MSALLRHHPETVKHTVHTTEINIVVKSVVVGAPDVVGMGKLSIFIECVTVKHTVHTIDGNLTVKSVVVSPMGK